MNFKRLLHTEQGKTIISILLGLGLASLFRKICKDKNCIDFKGPVLKDYEGQTYKYNDKCYKYTVEAASCVENKETIEIGESMMEQQKHLGY